MDRTPRIFNQLQRRPELRVKHDPEDGEVAQHDYLRRCAALVTTSNLDVHEWRLREEAEVDEQLHGDHQGVEQRSAGDVEADRKGFDEDLAIELLLHVYERNWHSKTSTDLERTRLALSGYRLLSRHWRK